MTGQLRGRLWLYLAEAAEVSGKTVSTLARQCRKKKRRCRKVGKGRGHWQVPASDFRTDGGR